ncbi:MAG TPA: TonB family protein [Gemmatimonadaceae bacterium]|jgi:protein TonB|nr:TonB family protein [Gemmatimonadaceae bacterium]
MRLPLCAAALVALSVSHAASAQVSQTSNETGPNQSQAYFEFQVEKPVLARPGNPHAQFPDEMRSRGKGGEVIVQYVVDTLGRVDVNSVEVIKSTDNSFTRSVKSVLAEMRFFPAETAGHRVRQMVQQSFRFAL